MKRPDLVIGHAVHKLGKVGRENIVNLLCFRWSEWGRWRRLIVISAAVTGLVFAAPFAIAGLPAITGIYLISCTIKNIVDVANNWKWGPIFPPSKKKLKTPKETPPANLRKDVQESDSGMISENIQEDCNSERMFKSFEARKDSGESKKSRKKEAEKTEVTEPSEPEEEEFEITSK